MIRLLPGDCRSVLATLPADSVHCVVTSPPYYALRSYLDASHADKHREIGSEPTPEAYLQTMVEVFREVRRVLRPDGTCWVNMGDSYSTGGGYSPDAPSNLAGSKQSHNHGSTKRAAVSGAKPKDLLMMPARLALALQADGWWIRSDIIWHKPNPMPESCTDRPTSAHEHVFLLTRSARYFYDADAVREEGITTPEQAASKWATRRAGNGKGQREGVYHAGAAPFINDPNPLGRNLRNVWTLATHPYPQAHFATYPPALAERCIKSGSSERGCCAQCGKPWVRVITSDFSANARNERLADYDVPGLAKRSSADRVRRLDGKNYQHVREATGGWQPGCAHDADIVPCVVLDPFAGAGTTLLVADRLQRDAIGIELNVAYTQMAMARVRADAPLFADMPPVPEHPEDRQMADLFRDMAAD